MEGLHNKYQDIFRNSRNRKDTLNKTTLSAELGSDRLLFTPSLNHKKRPWNYFHPSLVRPQPHQSPFVARLLWSY